MTRRTWFYLISLIIIVTLGLWYSIATHKIDAQVGRVQAAGLDDQTKSWDTYLAKQTDEHKLVRLLKKLTYADPKVLEMITLKAYELAPDNRDIVILASYFKPELKEKILQLDPLYQP